VQRVAPAPARRRAQREPPRRRHGYAGAWGAAQAWLAGRADQQGATELLRRLEAQPRATAAAAAQAAAVEAAAQQAKELAAQARALARQARALAQAARAQPSG